MSSEKRRRVPEVLWKLFHGRARTLGDTILSLIPPKTSAKCICDSRNRCFGCNAPSLLIRRNDPDDYQKLLNQCFVVVSDNAPPFSFYDPSSRWSLNEVVWRSIEMTITEQSSGSNVISSGYDQLYRSSDTVELLTLPAWKLLHKKIGDALMVYLLKSTSIFLPLSHNKHHQVAGFPIEFRKKRSVVEVYSSSRKKRKSNKPAEAISVCMEVLPSGEAQCYSSALTPVCGKRKRPFKWQRQKKRRLHNAQEHSLIHPESCKTDARCSCCLVLQTLKKGKDKDQISKKSMFYKMKSCSSMLPSNHILNSLVPHSSEATRLFNEIFGSVGDHIVPCMHNSNCSLNSSTCLYHSIIKLLKTLIRKVRHCQYLRLLEKHCSVPSLDQCIGNTSEKMSEDQVNEPEQSSLAKDCTNRHTSSPLEPTKCYCLKKQVTRFIWAVCRSVVPIKLLGTPSNWRVLQANISKLVNLRRFEKFSIKQAMRNIKLSQYPLLSDECSALLKQKVLEGWIFWLFSSFIMPLVQANYYVTETQHEKNEVFYYRKPTWANIISEAVTSLRDQGYQESDVVSVREIIKKRLFGFSRVRFCPKERGVRMLANLKAPVRLPVSLPLQSRGLRKVCYGRHIKYLYYKPVNEVLKDWHLVLKHVVANKPEVLGSSVFNYNDVYRRLVPFLLLLKSRHSLNPGAFFFVADVKRAFDSVDQEKLLKVLDDLDLEDEYSLREVFQVLCINKSLCNISSWTLKSKENVGCLTAHSLPGVLVNRQVQVRKVRKQQLISVLKEHIKRNVLQVGDRFFLQSVGIPQGSVLSPLLCSLYYGHLEKSVLFPFLEDACQPSPGCPLEECSDPKYMLLRFIDDFLFISTSKEQASRFFSRLKRGIRAYNCEMNDQKFGSNFVPGLCPDRLYVGDGTSFLRWSGLFINCATLEIQADYTGFLNGPLSSALTVGWLKNPGRELKSKLCTFLRTKCHALFYDSNINSAVVVRLNIYQQFLLCAMKFHCYVYALSSLYRFNAKFYADAVAKSVRYVKGLIKRTMLSFNTGSDIRPILAVGNDEIEWLGLTAYIRVLKRKESRYKELLRMFGSKLRALRELESSSPVLLDATNDNRSSVLWQIKY